MMRRILWRVALAAGCLVAGGATFAMAAQASAAPALSVRPAAADGQLRGGHGPHHAAGRKSARGLGDPGLRVLRGRRGRELLERRAAAGRRARVPDVDDRASRRALVLERIGDGGRLGCTG